ETIIKFILTILFFFLISFGSLVFYWVKIKYPKVPFLMIFFIILVYGFLSFFISTVVFILLKLIYQARWKFLPF
ncbi:MAG: hypothetical protein ACPLZH_00865, partial [Minisyncoccales bacterium]